MRIQSFFYNVLFHPCDSAIEAFSSVASLACRILHAIRDAATALSGCFTHRPPNQVTEQDQRMSSIKDNVLSEPPLSSELTFSLPPEIKPTLDKLFEGSPYSIDDLPTYPFLLTPKSCEPKRDVMAGNPVMKGMHLDGRPFIAIALNCSDKHEEKKTKKNVLVLYQYHLTGKAPWSGQGEFWWEQARGGRNYPYYFSGNFTYAETGEGPTNSQIKQFEKVKKLLQGESVEDLKGIVWSLSSN